VRGIDGVYLGFTEKETLDGDANSGRWQQGAETAASSH
jgi:hypothetical protein